MKTKLILIITLIGIMSSNMLHAQENDEKLLQTGIVKPISYQINGIEQIEPVQWMIVEFSEYESSYYGIDIQIGYGHYSSNGGLNDDEIKSYFFYMTVRKRTEKIIEGKLEEFAMDEDYFNDEHVNGTIKIDLDSKLVTVEIVYPEEYQSEKHKIVWENRRISKDIFLEIGEQWQADNQISLKIGEQLTIMNLDNETHEWEFNIFPDEGFSVIEQTNLGEESVWDIINTDGTSYTETFPARYISSHFIFTAEKVGKYKLTLNKGMEQYTCEIIVEKSAFKNWHKYFQ